MKNKRNPVAIVITVLAIVAAVAACVWFLWLKDYLSLADATPVYVNSVSSIVGLDTSTNPRYTGIVEPQQTYSINKDESKTVAEVFVEPGDEIHVGDLLFRYDTEELRLTLTQAELDQEGMDEQITTLNRQLTTLQGYLKNAKTEDDRYAYTVQINTVEVQIKQQQINSDKKKAEVEQLKTFMENTDVFSEVDGIVKEVNNGTQANYGEQKAFISVLSSGNYRIKGTISELNVASISVGQMVTIHSRLDDKQTWSGIVTSIDDEAATEQNQNYYYYGMNSGERSSNYHFYVDPEYQQGLMLGQHVYIEPSVDTPHRQDGLWLPAVYVTHDDDGSFVWARNDSDRLEKRLISLGEYDADSDAYQITRGLARADYIAFPNDELRAGLPTTTDTSYDTPVFIDDMAGVDFPVPEDEPYAEGAEPASVIDFSGLDEFEPIEEEAVG